jgi:hypothetical protein
MAESQQEYQEEMKCLRSSVFKSLRDYNTLTYNHGNLCHTKDSPNDRLNPSDILDMHHPSEKGEKGDEACTRLCCTQLT